MWTNFSPPYEVQIIFLSTPLAKTLSPYSSPQWRRPSFISMQNKRQNYSLNAQETWPKTCLMQTMQTCKHSLGGGGINKLYRQNNFHVSDIIATSSWPFNSSCHGGLHEPHVVESKDTTHTRPLDSRISQLLVTKYNKNVLQKNIRAATDQQSCWPRYLIK